MDEAWTVADACPYSWRVDEEEKQRREQAARPTVRGLTERRREELFSKYPCVNADHCFFDACERLAYPYPGRSTKESFLSTR